MKFRTLTQMFCINICISFLCYSQISWYQTNGPLGGLIFDQLYHNGILYSGSNAGIYISIDNGNTFSSWGLQEKLISAIAVDSSGYLYVGTFDSKLYKTNTTKPEWEILNFPFSGTINDIQYHQSSGHIFVATKLGGIFISSDSGKTWNAANTGLPSPFITSILVTQKR